MTPPPAACPFALPPLAPQREKPRFFPPVWTPRKPGAGPLGPVGGGLKS